MLAQHWRFRSVVEVDGGATLEALDPDAPPLAPGARAEVEVALGLARWLEAMALAWEEIESQRLRRSYMIGSADGGGSSVRPCPVARTDAA